MAKQDLDKQMDELVDDIIALGTDHANGAFPDGKKSDGTFAPQNEAQAKTALKHWKNKQVVAELEELLRLAGTEYLDENDKSIPDNLIQNRLSALKDKQGE